MDTSSTDNSNKSRGPLGISRNWWMLMAAGIGIALFVTLFSPFASGHPDGLEKVAENEGFLEEGEGPSYEIIPDYTFPGVENERVATILSGIVGVLLVAALGLGLGYLMRRSRTGDTTPSTPSTSSGSGSS